ncbi:D-aminopeptidase [Clostridium tepidiprofundi DSM 19306]|uniref:D-aminopeptidase n=1 Tax=Clostridium tepidiprofundi DSM 19306 TaxID=1121338 RepID=A0A151B050_9CLOT|nr:M55 family metallopeptidase [Clostridium tepidiprofundi]KYH33295.1 D-aminopeptidase [Clostridium tepidiprofundi DSM 19306]
MKIYISLDMEGIAGTFNWKQEDKDRQSVKKQITNQVEWVIKGIKESSKNSSIEEIVIADSHSGGDNLHYDITEIDDRIHIISGYPRPQYMMPALDESYDLIFFVGYHAGVGTSYASMDHTYSGSRVHKIWINDIPMNEALINSAYAAYYNIPVALVIGDKALEKELMVENAMPWVKYVCTKEALSRYSAKLKPIGQVKKETIEAVKNVLNSDIDNFSIYQFKTPVKLTIEFQTSAMADVAALMPGTKRLDGRTLEFTHEDYKILFDALMALITLSSTVN